MRHNYRLILQYDGTKFNGWQKQGNTNATIQGLLEELLSKYFMEQIALKGSGRTDRGVHAYGQVANFYTLQEVKLNEFKQWFNNVLPNEIRVTKVEEVPLSFHSRKSAISKVYEYSIWNSEKKNVFYRNYAYTVCESLDVEKMEQAAKLLCGTHDFIGFSSLKESKKSTVRTIYDITIYKEGEFLRIRYTGNGFLYHMVRILTGTLIEVGKGNMSAEEAQHILEHRNRTLAGKTVPAEGLKLISVAYE